MKIQIVERATVVVAQLCDAHRFDAFAVEVAVRGRSSDVEAVLSRLGRRDGDHVFISAGMIQDLAGRDAQSVGWSARLDDMIAYAATRGWTDEDNNVRAHIAFTNEPSNR